MLGLWLSCDNYNDRDGLKLVRSVWHTICNSASIECPSKYGEWQLASLDLTGSDASPLLKETINHSTCMDSSFILALSVVCGCRSSVYKCVYYSVFQVILFESTKTDCRSYGYCFSAGSTSQLLSAINICAKALDDDEDSDEAEVNRECLIQLD